MLFADLPAVDNITMFQQPFDFRLQLFARPSLSIGFFQPFVRGDADLSTLHATLLCDVFERFSGRFANPTDYLAVWDVGVHIHKIDDFQRNISKLLQSRSDKQGKLLWGFDYPISAKTGCGDAQHVFLFKCFLNQL